MQEKANITFYTNGEAGNGTVFVTMPLFFQMPILFAAVFSSFRLILSAFGWDQVEYHTKLMDKGLCIQYWLYGLCMFVCFQIAMHKSTKAAERVFLFVPRSKWRYSIVFYLGSHMTVINSETFARLICTFANYCQFYNKYCRNNMSNGKVYFKSKFQLIFFLCELFFYYHSMDI